MDPYLTTKGTKIAQGALGCFVGFVDFVVKIYKNNDLIDWLIQVCGFDSISLCIGSISSAGILRSCVLLIFKLGSMMAKCFAICKLGKIMMYEYITLARF